MNIEDLTLPQDDASRGLSELADEFSGELRSAGGLDTTDDVRTAGLLLRLVTELMPVSVRSSLLFLAWREWSRGVTAAIRVEIAERADVEAAWILQTADPTALDPTAKRIWSDYADRLHRLVTEHRLAEQPLLNYWLFEHTHRTMRLLGVSPLAAASASRSLRSALSAGLECSTAATVFAAPSVAGA